MLVRGSISDFCPNNLFSFLETIYLIIKRQPLDLLNQNNNYNIKFLKEYRKREEDEKYVEKLKSNTK